MMPDINGIDFIRTLRKLYPADSVPILMVTAAHEKEVRYECLRAGANDFLTKPIDRHEFDPRVRTMLALRQSHLRVRSYNDDLREAVIRKTADIVARERETVARLARAAEFRDPETGAHILQTHGATACTDLTGFGLLGHLVEMTRPSGVDAELNMSTLPLLDGAVDCVKAGIVSSLQPANVRLRRALRNADEFVSDPRYPLLFDPQTAGGLLASVPAAQAASCVQALKAAGYAHTAIIGRITAPGEAIEPVLLKT